MSALIDFKRARTDPTYGRIVREMLEAAEGTPRADILNHIQSMEFSLSLAEEALKDGLYDVAAVGISGLYDSLNALYLLLSPEADETLPVPPLDSLTTDN